MRGTKSISGNNNALYVVDGVPLANISGEQPDDQYTVPDNPVTDWLTSTLMI